MAPQLGLAVLGAFLTGSGLPSKTLMMCALRIAMLPSGRILCSIPIELSTLAWACFLTLLVKPCISFEARKVSLSIVILGHLKDQSVFKLLFFCHLVSPKEKPTKVGLRLLGWWGVTYRMPSGATRTSTPGVARCCGRSCCRAWHSGYASPCE